VQLIQDEFTAAPADPFEASAAIDRTGHRWAATAMRCQVAVLGGHRRLRPRLFRSDAGHAVEQLGQLGRRAPVRRACRSPRPAAAAGPAGPGAGGGQPPGEPGRRRARRGSPLGPGRRRGPARLRALTGPSLAKALLGTRDPWGRRLRRVTAVVWGKSPGVDRGVDRRPGKSQRYVCFHSNEHAASLQVKRMLRLSVLLLMRGS
jgi:hypothetical protein